MNTTLLISIAMVIAAALLAILFIEMKRCNHQRQAVQANLQDIYDSCIEGQLGVWDGSPEGFICMEEAIIETAKFLNLHIEERI